MKFYINIIAVAQLLLYCSNLHAQFNGGIEDGHDVGSSNGALLSGYILKNEALYYGSDGEGTATYLFFGGINGESIDIYSGGKDDGEGHKQLTFSMQGVALEAIYRGEKNEGSAVYGSQQTLGGIASSSFYSGGFGEGHDVQSFSNLLNANNAYSMFNGGINDGFGSTAGYGIVTAGDLRMFEGSKDEGSDIVMYSGPLDLRSQNLLYSGGADDGFYIELQSALVLIGPTGIREEDITGSITLYPNPVVGQDFYIRFSESLTLKKISSVNLYSLQGSKYPINYSREDDVLKITLLDALKPSMYILTINLKNNISYTIKLIVENR